MGQRGTDFFGEPARDCFSDVWEVLGEFLFAFKIVILYRPFNVGSSKNWITARKRRCIVVFDKSSRDCWRTIFCYFIFTNFRSQRCRYDLDRISISISRWKLAGIFIVVSESTEKVRSRRRLKLLRYLRIFENQKKCISIKKNNKLYLTKNSENIYKLK